MNAYPIQVTLIDSGHSPGDAAELGVLSTDFPDGPPQRLNICEVSWVRLDQAAAAGVSPDPSARRSVRYRSTTPITWGFLRYLDCVLTYPYAAKRLAVQPLA
jgi:hypothetical protein